MLPRVSWAAAGSAANSNARPPISSRIRIDFLLGLIAYRPRANLATTYLHIDNRCETLARKEADWNRFHANQVHPRSNLVTVSSQNCYAEFGLYIGGTWERS